MQDYLTTRQLAERFQVKPGSIISAYCRAGHYFGLTPVKLPNRLLRWPAAEVRRLLGEEGGAP